MDAMFKRALVLLTLLMPSLFSKEKGDTLVCVHGFMGAGWNMLYLENRLSRDGWDVVNWEYPSRECLISEHGAHLVSSLIDLANKKPDQPIHFVTHSMGGLVLLAALNHPECPQEAKIGKVALIAPPLRGSHWGRFVGQFSWARWLSKDFSGRELMTKSSFEDLGRYPDSLQDLLVVAGSFGFNPLLNEQNDGTIALSETTLSTPHQHAVIHRSHKMLVFSKQTAALVRQFFQA
jgi:pimeloyl-ACP methyl ester carboxylesterase